MLNQICDVFCEGYGRLSMASVPNRLPRHQSLRGITGHQSITKYRRVLGVTENGLSRLRATLESLLSSLGAQQIGKGNAIFIEFAGGG